MATSSLALNSGTIKDSGKQRNVDLSNPWTKIAPLAANKALIVDAVIPVVSSVTSLQHQMDII